MIRWREVNVFVLSVIASVVSRCFSAFCRRASAATKKAGRYGTKAAGFRRPVAAFLRAPRAPSVGQACPAARVPLGVGGRCRRFAPCAEAARACPAVGRRPPRARSDRLHAKHPACTVRRCKRGACCPGRKRAAGQKRGPRPPGPPCPPPGGGMTGRNLLPGRPSGPCPSGGSGILAPPKRLSR